MELMRKEQMCIWLTNICLMEVLRLANVFL